jgi:hypothetical protein
VLSTTTSAPAAWASSTTAVRSVSSSSGLLGVSTSTSRVCGRIARANASVSVWSTWVYDTPNRDSRPVASEVVPPYVLRCTTTWSPAESRASAMVLTAPIPEAVTSPVSAPSSSATTAATWAWFGLP